MRKLFVMRHAKSSWDDASLSDFDRPLNDRGKRTAPFMGEFMAKKGLVPDVIISSPAVRARSTTESVVKKMKYSGDVTFDPEIYDAGPNTLLQIVSEISNEHCTAMLVGHNPGLESLIHHLTNIYEPMPTGALAVIELPIDDWSEIRGGVGRLAAFYRPRELMK
jgi:phosphohistidine phosphatase